MAWLAARRVSARQPSYLFLLAQKNVTQKEGLNTSLFEGRAAAAHLRPRLWHENIHRMTATCTSLTPNRSSPPRLAPAGHRGDAESLNLSEETDAVARCLFSCQSLGRQPSSRSEKAKWAGVQALCFGDFHLGPQMKVTRLPGRNPARCTASAKALRISEPRRARALKMAPCES